MVKKYCRGFFAMGQSALQFPIERINLYQRGDGQDRDSWGLQVLLLSDPRHIYHKIGEAIKVP